MMDNPYKNIFLYGAPASGKSTVARWLGETLGCAAIDLDEEIERKAGCAIAEIFAMRGEAAFRALEAETLRKIVAEDGSARRVIALGGGTLLRGPSRQVCESAGTVVCLDTPDEAELVRRIAAGGGTRPLGNKAVERAAHYASFTKRISRVFRLPDSLVIVGTGIGRLFLEGARIVADATVAGLHLGWAGENILTAIPSGEKFKTPETIMNLWRVFGEAGLGRRDCVAACGGGVTGDLVGFAAATWMRGIPWMNFPTTLLAMVDASTGGKTGCDLPAGKNLVGAFHSPRLVVIDTDFLRTLPPREIAGGRAEMIKHSIIGLDGGRQAPPMASGVPTAAEIAESLAVKVRIVKEDPLETLGARLLLNCGHTIGHAVEAASDYVLSHGEAVAIGCVAEARIAVRQGCAPSEWPDELAEHFRAAGLPVELPAGMTLQNLSEWIRQDKKKISGGAIRFALPCGWGDVRAMNIRCD